ncbi:MAG: YihY family inner membrane protein [Candidatus Omnitrophica bacterium]|nr:YihY family inner membrane protein [Candidatus Omnitrophota bacterium]MDE2231702.1 YihY family inner membrane protein [Candidatus Omnitrophota bacterium]
MAYVIRQIVNFLDRDIWRIHTKKLPRRKSFLIKQLRVLVLAIREFRDNKCQLNASSLTFYTLLSIVPLAAMAFGIAKGFGLDQVLAKQLLQKFPGQQETISQIIGFANNLLKNTQGGLVAGVGVIILFWTVIKVLNSIENSFNDIWGIKKSRSFGRKVSDYLSMMLICPFLVIISSTATVFVSTQVDLILRKLSFLGALTTPVLFSLNFLPYVMMWLLLGFIYIFMPNTKVKPLSAFIGGVVAGTIYQLVQIIYIKFQVGVASANAIYGSFAALPLFLIWLQLSWRIVLFGTEVSFAHQNVDTYEFEHDCLNVSLAFKQMLALYISTVLVKRFAAGESSLTANQLTDQLDIPIRLVREILFELTEAGILSEIKDATDRESSFQPARDIDHLTVRFVQEALEKKGTGEIPVVQGKELAKIQECLKGFDDQIKQSRGNRLLKDI